MRTVPPMIRTYWSVIEGIVEVLEIEEEEV